MEIFKVVSVHKDGSIEVSYRTYCDNALFLADRMFEMGYDVTVYNLSKAAMYAIVEELKHS